MKKKSKWLSEIPLPLKVFALLGIIVLVWMLATKRIGLEVYPGTFTPEVYDTHFSSPH